MTEEDLKNIDMAIKAAVQSASVYRNPAHLIEVSVSWIAVQRFHSTAIGTHVDDAVYPSVSVKFSP